MTWRTTSATTGTIEASGAAVPPLPERGDDERTGHLNTLLRRLADADQLAPHLEHQQLLRRIDRRDDNDGVGNIVPLAETVRTGVS